MCSSSIIWKKNQKNFNKNCSLIFIPILFIDLIQVFLIFQSEKFMNNYIKTL